MSNLIFHPSLEGAQHGGKSLTEFLDFAKKSGCKGVQPSYQQLQDADGRFWDPKYILEEVQSRGLHLDGISCHTLTWCHGTAWTKSKTIRPFLPADLLSASVKSIETTLQDDLFILFEMAAALDVHVLPMFWGLLFGWEVATGYPWGFFVGPDYDLIQEGKDRFVEKTAKIRERANANKISLAHEIHPGTCAQCADEFLLLLTLTDGDKCLGVNADPSHCWDGETWQTRFTKVGPYVTGCHVKDHVVHKDRSLRSMLVDWKYRGMQFTMLGQGQLDLRAYTQMMINVGYTQRYTQIHQTETAPLVGEAESAFYDLDMVSAAATHYINKELCLPMAVGSFEDGMKKK